MKNRHNLALKGSKGTAAVQSSVHFVGNPLLGTNRCLDDVKEGANRSVHLAEEGGVVFHIEVREDAVVILEGSWVNPFCFGVAAHWGHFIGACDNQHGHDVNEVSTHVDSTVNTGPLVVQGFNWNTC